MDNFHLFDPETELAICKIPSEKQWENVSLGHPPPDI